MNAFQAQALAIATACSSTSNSAEPPTEYPPSLYSEIHDLLAMVYAGIRQAIRRNPLDDGIVLCTVTKINEAGEPLAGKMFGQEVSGVLLSSVFYILQVSDCYAITRHEAHDGTYYSLSWNNYEENDNTDTGTTDSTDRGIPFFH